MDLFSTHSSGTKTLNTSHENSLPAAPSSLSVQANVSRRTTSFQIKKSYEPHIDEDRFREKRVNEYVAESCSKAESRCSDSETFPGLSSEGLAAAQRCSLGGLQTSCRSRQNNTESTAERASVGSKQEGPGHCTFQVALERAQFRSGLCLCGALRSPATAIAGTQ